MATTLFTKLLDENQVHLWYVRTEDAKRRGWLTSYQNLLCDSEKKRHRRFLFEKDRDQFLIAHALVRNVLSRYANVEPADWRFQFGPHGKPAISEAQNAADLRFNLSHCDGLSVCGVACQREIGVDCENTGRSPDYLGMARRFFSSAESSVIESLPADERKDAFFDFWTLKEAYIKAEGKGLSIPLSGFAFAIKPGDISIQFTPQVSDNPGNWLFSQPQIDGPYKVAVALKHTAPSRLQVALYEA